MLKFVLLVCGFAAVSAQSETVPYRFPMLLGRGYNIDNHKVGGDLFSVDEVKKAIVKKNTLSDVYYKIISQNSEANDFLDVKGELSLNVKAGNVNFKGTGSYLRDIQNRQKVVEILVRHKFNTVKKTMHSSSIPSPDCTKLQPSDRGTHYIRSVQYGGMLVGSLRFVSNNEKDKQDIEAAVKGGVGLEGKFGLDVEGKFKKLTEKIKGEYRIEYAIYSTALLDKTPGSVEEFLKVVEEFPTKARQDGEEGGIGVPTNVELYTIDNLRGCQPSPPINWRRNNNLNGDINDVEAKFDDIRITRDVFNTWSRKVDLTNVKDNVLMQFSTFNKQLRGIDRTLRRTISNLDVSDKADYGQFDAAFDEYEGDDGLGDMNNLKYRRLFHKMQTAVRQEGCIAKKCPPGAVSNNGNCYMIKTEHGYTWSEARRQCLELYGNAAELASVATSAEADWLSLTVSRKTPASSPSVWIGGRRSGTNYNQFIWSDESRWGVTKWAVGEPNNAGGNERCLEMMAYHHDKLRGRTWNDLPCEVKRGYVCKLKPACTL